MPLFAVVGFFLSLLSLLVFGSAGYLLWSWFEGSVITGEDGLLYRVRDEWRLWLAVGLLAWSFLGRFVVLSLAARQDTTPSRPERRNGQIIEGAEGATLYVESHGPADAQPIIFTHGWGLDSTIWGYARDELAGPYRVILWDLPGLGRSKGEVSLESFANNLRAVITFANHKAPVLVGHSIGGMTVQTLARDHPEVFDGIAGAALFNTTYTNPLKTMVFSRLMLALRRPLLEPVLRVAVLMSPVLRLAAWQSYLSGSAHLTQRLGFGAYVTRSQLDHAALLVSRNSPGVQARGNLAMFAWDATQALSNRAVPILVVGGSVDIVTKLAASAVIARSADAAEMEIEPKVNHMGFLERHDSYNAMLREFAERCRQVEAARRDRYVSSGPLTVG